MLEPEILELPAFKVAGLPVRTNVTGDKNFLDIDTLWGRYDGERAWKEIPDITPNRFHFGVTTEISENGALTYIAGKEVSSFGNLTRKHKGIDIPAGFYAIFSLVDYSLEDVKKAYRLVFNTWLPGSDYEFRGWPFFEKFGGKEQRNRLWIHIPVNESEPA